MKQVMKIGVLVLALALTGCATSKNPKDPLENFNRTMFSFNDFVDQAALKPAATTYKSLLPSFVQTGIGNFFGNIGDVWTAVNNMLQGKFENGLSDVMRVAVNSTLGLGGLLDIGSEAGLTKHNEDFGQTLGTWGVRSGPYIVLPLLGSSTLRDSLALPVDFKGDPWGYKDPVRWRNTGTVVRVIDQRASVLDASDLIEAAAIDRYVFVRDAYLQRRESKIREKQSDRWSEDDEPVEAPVKEAPDVNPVKDKSSTNEYVPAEDVTIGAVPAVAVEPEMTLVVETSNIGNDETKLAQGISSARP